MNLLGIQRWWVQQGEEGGTSLLGEAGVVVPTPLILCPPIYLQDWS